MFNIKPLELKMHLKTLENILADYVALTEEDTLKYTLTLLRSILIDVQFDNVCVIRGTSLKESVTKLVKELPKGRVDLDLKIPLIKGIRAATGLGLKDAKAIIDDNVEFRNTQSP